MQSAADLELLLSLSLAVFPPVAQAAKEHKESIITISFKKGLFTLLPAVD
jgi:hypothetical protein